MTTEDAYRIVDTAISGIPCSRSQHTMLHKALHHLFVEASQPKQVANNVSELKLQEEKAKAE